VLGATDEDLDEEKDEELLDVGELGEEDDEGTELEGLLETAVDEELLEEVELLLETTLELDVELSVNDESEPLEQTPTGGDENEQSGPEVCPPVNCTV